MAALASYFFNEADSGSAPTVVVDQSGNGNDLTLNYDGGDAQYASTAQGRYLSVTAPAVSSAANARVAMNAGDLGADLEGATTFTVIFKQVGMQVPATNYGVIGEIGQAGQTPDLRIYVEPTGIYTVSSLGASCKQYSNTAKCMAFVFDSTQAVAADRLRGYRRTPENVNEAAAYNYVYPAQNAALTGINDASTFLTVMNRADLTRSAQGGLAFFHIESGALSQAQIYAIFDALDSNDDAAPLGAPTLSFLAAPSIDQQTAASYRVSFTSSLTVPYHVIRGTVGQGVGDMPNDAAFDAATITGTATAATVVQVTLTEQSAETTYPIFVRIGASAPYVYGFVEATTLAATNTIISVNGGAPISRDQTNIIVTMVGGAPTAGPVLLNGVAQSGFVRDSDTQFRFNFTVWPAAMYGDTIPLTIDGHATTVPITHKSGEAVTTLLGYTESPPSTLDFTADGVDLDQVVIEDQGGKIILQPDGTLILYPGAVSPLRYAIVDHTDGSHSAFADQPFLLAADLIPTIPTFSNLADQEPNTPIVDSFLCADVDAGYDITYAAVGAMQVASSNTGPWLSSVTRQLGETVWRRMITGAPGQTVTGGVSSGGQSQSCTYTTRAANAPTFTQQPTPNPAYAVVGGQISFSATVVNAASLQWLIDGNVVPGATQIPFVYTPDAVGTFGVQLRATSSEGASSLSNVAQLVVSPSLAKIELGPFYSDEDETVLLANYSIQARIRNAAGTVVVPQTAYLTSGLGTLVIASAAIGTPGAKVFFEYMVPGSFEDYRGLEAEVEAI